MQAEYIGFLIMYHKIASRRSQRRLNNLFYCEAPHMTKQSQLASIERRGRSPIPDSFENWYIRARTLFSTFRKIVWRFRVCSCMFSGGWSSSGAASLAIPWQGVPDSQFSNERVVLRLQGAVASVGNPPRRGVRRRSFRAL